MARQVQTLPRRAIVEESLANRGGIVETVDLEEAIELANAFAGEHLCLAVRDPWAWLGRIQHAGGVFLGELNAEAIGDYTAGPSHIMPTGGTARFSSPVNVDDFLKIISVFGLAADDLRQAGAARGRPGPRREPGSARPRGRVPSRGARRSELRAAKP